MLNPGRILGRYEILTPVGAGGMGEVYRARDTRLDRDVAIKILRTGFAGSPESDRRFEQEGRIAATLEHPHICRLLDVGSDGGVSYLVMEFLEGETLKQRLDRGRLPRRDVIGYAIEIATALRYAHERGIIHRDLKPSNILLTPTGAKILDFGLAKLNRGDHPPADLGALQTEPVPVTAEGSIVGTAHYLPPERLEGREADHRSDIWAFGLIIWEMLTGRRAFDAPNSAALIAAILTTEPTRVVDRNTGTPELEWVARHCLQKNPDARWQSASDLETILKWIARTTVSRDEDGQGRNAPRRRRVQWLAWTTGLLAVVAALAMLDRLGSRSAARSLTALTIPPPSQGAFTLTEGSVPTPQLAVSPDGRTIAFVAEGQDGVSQLWVRPLDSTVARALAGTAGAAYPFWSASSRSLGFFAAGALKRVDLSGGPPQILARAPQGRGGSWNADDVILFAPTASGALYRVTLGGPAAARLTSVAAAEGDSSHRWPHFLPNGRQFLYFVTSTRRSREGIHLAALDAEGGRLILASEFGGAFSPSGHLLFLAHNALFARRFDPRSARFEGDSILVVESVGGSSNLYPAFSVAPGGVLAFAGNASTTELVWFDRRGQRLAVRGGPAGRYVDFQLSPDDKYVAVGEVGPESERPDIHIRDLIRGTTLRLTSTRETDASPVWSADGTRLIFRSNRGGVYDLFQREANGVGDDRPISKSSEAEYPTDWSGRGLVVYHAHDEKTRWDVWAVPSDGSEPPRPLVRTDFDERQGQISSDGQWIAYTSDESSRAEVYVEALKASGRKWQVSVGGGSDPKWRSDGRELFYATRDGWLAAVSFESGATPVFGAPSRLVRVQDAEAAPPFLSIYEPAADGRRFLVRVPIENLRTMPLTVLVNWAPERRNGRD